MEFSYRNSIFNNINNCNGFSYIHFALIYKSENILILQMYADAMKTLFEVTKLNKEIYFKLIDNLVGEFSTKDYLYIHNYLINLSKNEDFLFKIQKKLNANSKEIKKLFLNWEENIKNERKTKRHIFKKIYNIIVFSLSINYFNFITETFLPQFLTSNQANEYNQYLSQNTFSHIKYFIEQKRNEKNDILTFARNFGFLSNEIGEETEYEDINFLRKQLGNNININDIFSGEYISPPINFTKKTFSSKNMPELLKLAKILQNNLEFRHYWQLRFIRNLRIELKDNKKATYTWLYKQYEKNLFDF